MIEYLTRTQIKKMREKLKELEMMGIDDNYWRGFDAALRMVHDGIRPIDKV